jgi:hypothetical protein
MTRLLLPTAIVKIGEAMKYKPMEAVERDRVRIGISTIV